MDEDERRTAIGNTVRLVDQIQKTTFSNPLSSSFMTNKIQKENFPDALKCVRSMQIFNKCLKDKYSMISTKAFPFNDAVDVQINLWDLCKRRDWLHKKKILLKEKTMTCKQCFSSTEKWTNYDAQCWWNFTGFAVPSSSCHKFVVVVWSKQMATICSTEQAIMQPHFSYI